MDERMKFVARFLDGEQMAPLCREFGIARKTGYKIVERYQSAGVEGLTDRSRRIPPGRSLVEAEDRNFLRLANLANAMPSEAKINEAGSGAAAAGLPSLIVHAPALLGVLSPGTRA